MKYICSECKKECTPEVNDSGIGPYEYWGMKGVDSHKELISDCCGAEVIDESGWPIDYYDYKYGILDAEADAKNDERWLKEHAKEHE